MATVTTADIADRQLDPLNPSSQTVALVHNALNVRMRSVHKRIAISAFIAVAACILFLTYDALDAWAMIAKLRSIRLISLVTVAVALSSATVIFQVVTRNRILTPSVMGFDAMYLLVATASVFFLTSAVVNRIPVAIMFAIQATMMTLMAVTLFMVMIRRGRNSVHLLVLVGIVLGVFMRSLTTMMTSIMDPNEYLNVQDIGLVSFSRVNTDALTATIVITISVIAYIMWRGKTWDILSLGPDLATALGINYRREVRLALAASSVLVAAATALVGPLMFFGLLIVNVSVFAVGSSKIRHLVPAAAFIGIAVLVGGQAVLEHVLDRATVLPVVIELVGGALLLVMIVKEARP